MGHEDFWSRRKEVAELDAKGIWLDTAMKRRIAEKYGASIGAIYADIAESRRQRLPNWRRTPSLYPTPNVKRHVHERDNGTCQYCLKRFGHDSLVCEHVIPKNMRGAGKPYNLVLACCSCNLKKGSSVWTPYNLLEITKQHPEWLSKVLYLASCESPHTERYFDLLAGYAGSVPT